MPSRFLRFDSQSLHLLLFFIDFVVQLYMLPLDLAALLTNNFTSPSSSASQSWRAVLIP